ncbi:MAG: helix-turn-helix transcriptional regulator [Alphaproteobacteria bacterium]|nr:helix-turn-helix transcriptional regulator [Alphaproteobacteria bacterium]
MQKAKANRTPNWVRNLRALMDEKGYNPRSLSLKAGLSPTAVRDMLEGRSRFPRYDTAKALADALDTTPAFLMGDEKMAHEMNAAGQGLVEDMELLTEIIARLREVTEELNRKLSPRDFAAMTTTIYKRIQASDERKGKIGSIRPQIHDLLDYEMLRQRSAKR